jgi:hypothetical protein
VLGTDWGVTPSREPRAELETTWSVGCVLGWGVHRLGYQLQRGRNETRGDDAASSGVNACALLTDTPPVIYIDFSSPG